MNYLRLAWRNLQHNVRQAATIALFVLVSAFSFLMLNSFVHTAQEKADHAIVSSLLGTVQVRPTVEKPTPIIDMSADWGAADKLTAAQVQEAVTALNKQGADAYPVVRGNVLIARAGFDPTSLGRKVPSRGATVPAVSMGVPKGMTTYAGNLDMKSGTALSSGAEAQTVLSTSIAKQLDVTAGDAVVLMSQGRDRSWRHVDAKVVGVGDGQSLAGFESRLTYLDYDAAVALKGFEQGAATDVLGYTTDLARSPQVRDATFADLSGRFRVTDWSDQGGYVTGINSAYTGIFYVFLTVILLIVCILVVNMVAVVSLERRQETAALRAIGFSRRRVVLLFVAEVIAAALVGATAAIALAAVVGSLLSARTFSVGPPLDAIVGSTFRLSFSWLSGLPGVIAILLLVALAAVHPSVRASARPPAEALSQD